MTKALEFYILGGVSIAIMFCLCVDVLARNFRKGHSAPLSSNLHELPLDSSGSVDAAGGAKLPIQHGQAETIEVVYPMYIDCSRRTA